MKSLVVDGLTVAYGSEIAANNVKFEVSAGEFVAITGRSGAGKSSVLNALAGLVSVRSGMATLDGEHLLSLAEPRSTLSRRKMGFVFQNATLFPELTVIQNVEWVGRLRGLSVREAKLAGLDNLAQLGIEKLADRRPSQISGGEAQRANIARALTGGISLFLVDEPTASLDEKTSGQVCSALSEAIDLVRVAALVVSHDPIVSGAADRVLCMERGVLAAE